MTLSDCFYCYFSNYCHQLLLHSTLCTLCHFIISSLHEGDSVHLDDEMKESEIGECGWGVVEHRWERYELCLIYFSPKN